MSDRPAFLNFNDWAARRSYAVVVVGETPARYRIRNDRATPLRLAGRRRYLPAGATCLVPKGAVSFELPKGSDLCP